MRQRARPRLAPNAASVRGRPLRAHYPRTLPRPTPSAPRPSPHSPPKAWDGVFISAGGHTRDSGIGAIASHDADLVAYGRWWAGPRAVCRPPPLAPRASPPPSPQPQPHPPPPARYISNPDLPLRLKLGAPLAKYNRDLFYSQDMEKVGGGRRGGVERHRCTGRPLEGLHAEGWLQGAWAHKEHANDAAHPAPPPPPLPPTPPQGYTDYPALT
jgi:hypothetical protein